MTRLPPFFALRALEAAARRRSYSRAADELSVTHSAVSQQIRALEAELGAKLFERRGNHMEPTAEARRLAGEVARALEILQNGVTDFIGSAQRDPLVLSVEGFMARRWLPSRLARLLSDPAGANLEIRVENRRVDFTTEDVDVGVRHGSGSWEGLQAQYLFGERVFPVCSPAMARQYDIRSAADLLAAPLLYRSSRPWTLWFDKFGLAAPPQQGLNFDDSILMLEASAEGLGVALAVEGLVDEDLRSGRLVRLLQDSIVTDVAVYIVWRADSPKLARIHALRDWLLAEVARDGAADP